MRNLNEASAGDPYQSGQGVESKADTKEAWTDSCRVVVTNVRTTLTAAANSNVTGVSGFCSDQDGVIRFAAGLSGAPINTNVAAVAYTILQECKWRKKIRQVEPSSHSYIPASNRWRRRHLGVRPRVQDWHRKQVH